ncbi:MAG: hypothetical protein JWN34_1994 [Bryobacterales bacterium]|nr:hypothetical protein [Bryobacterales bacterium]
MAYESAEVFEIKDAVRHATPQVIAVAGPTFSGKTFGAILLGSGLIEPGDMVGAIDTENGRFSKYADDPDVRRLIPQGIKVIELHPPFHPQRYIGANKALERAGCKLIITDSGSHAWDGEGGGQDMKEQDKGWKNAKLWTKRFSAALRYSTAHQIVCLRAQDKTKILGSGNSQQYIPLGMAPICEKNFYFDMELTFMVEGEVENRPATHLARPTKYPKGMNGLFDGWTPQLLTPEIGRRIREWNNTGAKENPMDRLKKRAALESLSGSVAYLAFYRGLNEKLQRAMVEIGIHDLNLESAKNVDMEAAVGIREEIEAIRDEFTPAKFRDLIGFERLADVPMADLQATLDRLREATKEAA